jgi:hypothetical protein
VAHRTIAGGQQPIQRTISLHGEAEDRDANVARLNALLGGSGARVKHEQGNVVFDAHPADNKGKEHASYRLLKRMVEHQHDVKIGIHPDKGAADPVMVPYDIPNASKLGTGSRAFIHMPKVAKPTATTVYDKDAKKFLTQDTPDHLQLGHELIHADHTQRGTLTPYDQEVERPLQGELAGYGAFDSRVREKKEELVTIGLAPGHESDDITENRLRHSLGQLPRASHDQLEAHLLREQGRHFERTKNEYAAIHQAALGHAASADQSRIAAEAATARMEESQRQEQVHRQSANVDLQFVQGLRGGSNDGSGIPWDQIADVHQANADAATRTADTHAAAAAQHQQERDRHDLDHQTHKANYAQAVEARTAKHAEMMDHHAKGTKLKQMLNVQ